MLTESIKTPQQNLVKTLTNDVKQLIAKQLTLDDVYKCINLQSTLSDLELHAYGQRTLDDYETMIQDGIMIGLYTPDNELIAQIGTDLKNKRKDYIISENPVIAKLLDNSVILEQGAYIVRKDYRGLGLQSKLELYLLEKIKSLIENSEKLKTHNEELYNSLLKSKSSLIVSGCSSENPASALTSLKNGSMLIGVKSGIVVNEGDEELTAYALAKPLTKIGKIIYDESNETKVIIKELLKEREELEKLQNNQIEELKAKAEILLKDISNLTDYEKKLKEIESIKKLKANPLPKSWVVKVAKAGYIISKDSKKYNLHKPILIKTI